MRKISYECIANTTWGGIKKNNKGYEVTILRI